MTSIHPPFSSLHVQVDGQTPESWSDILAQFTDANIYQTWAYGAVRWGARSLSHLVMRGDGDVLAAAQLRIVRLPLLAAGVAYLRWGPLFVTADKTVWTHMAQALEAEYVDRRRLALQILPNAFQGTRQAGSFDAAFWKQGFRPQSVAGSPYRTHLVDLCSPLPELRKRLDQKWRNQLNRAEKNGLTCRLGKSPGEYETFLSLYRSMWNRKRFETTVDVTEFASIQSLLRDDQKMAIMLAYADGQPVAGLVCTHMGDTGIYLLGATNERARELKAAYLLQWQMIVHLKENGVRCYDLGGIDPDSNPSVHHFKSGLHGVEAIHLPSYGLARGGLSAVIQSAAYRFRRAYQKRMHPLGVATVS